MSPVAAVVLAESTTLASGDATGTGVRYEQFDSGNGGLMSPNARMWTTAVVAAVTGLLVGAGAVYYVAAQRLDTAKQQLIVAEKAAETQNARTATLESKLDDLSAQLSSALESSSAAGPDASVPSSSPAAGAGAKTSVRQYAFVKAAEDDAGDIILSLDYAQFLTGKAAAKAATAAGDESPPPNDYYITNVNPKTRKLKVAPSAMFVLAYSSPSDRRTLSAGEFYDAIINNTDGKAGAGYWFDIAGDTVTGGEEQWTP